MEVINDYITN